MGLGDDMKIEQLLERVDTYLNESLNGYEVEGKIVHNKDGYNIADNKDNLMLNKNIPSLKQLLLELAKYM